jgi:hypothetical protein
MGVGVGWWEEAGRVRATPRRQCCREEKEGQGGEGTAHVRVRRRRHVLSVARLGAEGWRLSGSLTA